MHTTNNRHAGEEIAGRQPNIEKESYRNYKWILDGEERPKVNCQASILLVTTISRTRGDDAAAFVRET